MLSPMILLKCLMFLVISVYPLVRVIPAIIASLRLIGVPLHVSSERISPDFLAASKFSSRIFIELRRLSAYLMFCSASLDLKGARNKKTKSPTDT